MLEIALALWVVVRVGIAHQGQVVLEHHRELLRRTLVLSPQSRDQFCQPSHAGASARRPVAPKPRQLLLGSFRADQRLDRTFGSPVSYPGDDGQGAKP